MGHAHSITILIMVLVTLERIRFSVTGITAIIPVIQLIVVVVAETVSMMSGILISIIDVSRNMAGVVSTIIQTTEPVTLAKIVCNVTGIMAIAPATGHRFEMETSWRSPSKPQEVFSNECE